MKYRLRKLIDKHNPNNQKYTDFKLLGGDQENTRTSDSDDEYTCVRWSKRHPVGRMKTHADLALSQEFRRCTDTLPFQPASPSVIQSLQKATEEESRVETVEVVGTTAAEEVVLPEAAPTEREEGQDAMKKQAPAPVEQEIVLENSDSDSEYEADTGGIEDAEEKEDTFTKEGIVQEKQLEKSSSGDSAVELAGELVSDTIKTASEIVSQESAAPDTTELPTAVVPTNTPVPQELPTEVPVDVPATQELPKEGSTDVTVPQESSTEVPVDSAVTPMFSTEVPDDDAPGQSTEDGGEDEEEPAKRTVVEHAVEIPGPDLDSSTEEERSQEIKSILKGSSDADGLSNKSVKFS